MGTLRCVQATAFKPATNAVQKPEELVQIVDEQNQAVGKATRAEMRAKNLIHRCSFTIVENRQVGILFKLIGKVQNV